MKFESVCVCACVCFTAGKSGEMRGERERRKGDRGMVSLSGAAVLAEGVQAFVHVLGRRGAEALAAVCAGIGLLPGVDAHVRGEVGGV